MKKVSEDTKKYHPGDKHELGISRTIYAAGYGLKDGIVWGTVAAVGLLGLLTAGKKYEIPGVGAFAEGLVKKHHDLHNWFKRKKSEVKWLKWFEPAVVEASIATWFIVGHLVQIPSSALGWSKAQDAIDKHEKLLGENTRLVEATSILAEDNEMLKGKLTALKENRPAATDKLRAQSLEVTKSATTVKESSLLMADRIRAQQLAETANTNII